jgi:hypothetical protein
MRFWPCIDGLLIFVYRLVVLFAVKLKFGFVTSALLSFHFWAQTYVPGVVALGLPKEFAIIA